ncbi:sulfate permease [Microbacterium sp. 2MCAF23]|uniref:sulfate permease n=1 Tax=Microbacterium sp. 2MCAF23 TaxID=3232985 RepID=UPI003F9C0B49
MIRLILGAVARAFYVMQHFIPSLRLLARLRRRDRLKWGIPAMLIAVPYLFVASTCVEIVADGGPGWLNLVVLWCLLVAAAFIVNGPVSLLRLATVRIDEATVERATQRHGGHRRIRT